MLCTYISAAMGLVVECFFGQHWMGHLSFPLVALNRCDRYKQAAYYGAFNKIKLFLAPSLPPKELVAASVSSTSFT